MNTTDKIKNYFFAANYLTLEMMYLRNHTESSISSENLKDYNPGHLGTSMSINFILANLYYYLNQNDIPSKVVIGTGHAGVSLLSNLWLSKTLSKYYEEYPTNINGLNNLINDFGTKIRSEINPEYPETIYDGGELGYSLSVAYGYALKSKDVLVPCIIGDGESETGTLNSSLQLNRILNPNSKVLPIINLNQFKMGSNSYLSRLSDEELKKYYESFGYNVFIIDAIKEPDLLKTIELFQNTLANIQNVSSPLIIIKTKKGFTLPDLNEIKLEGNKDVHKNPLSSTPREDKRKIIEQFLEFYKTQLFKDGYLLDMFNEFALTSPKEEPKKLTIPNQAEQNKSNIKEIEDYLKELIEENDMCVFSPDELFSNGFGKLEDRTIELLSENVLQGLYQGYVASKNNGFYIAYEGFMPLISSMITQYYKCLVQKKHCSFSEELPSLNYILTSTCFENTYSHQNPDFVNGLLLKDDFCYNILYPKDGCSTIECIRENIGSKDKINIITTSKRHTAKYPKSSYQNIETIKNEENPEVIICATGDYMLDAALEISKKLDKRTKIVYVTNPKVLDKNSRVAITDEVFQTYFNPNTPIIYLFQGNPNIIKSLLYERQVITHIYGYEEMITAFGNLNNNLESNHITTEEIQKVLKRNGG